MSDRPRERPGATGAAVRVRAHTDPRAHLGTAAACATIVLASLVPGVLRAGTPAALLGIPVEAIALVLLLVLLPARWARASAAIAYGILSVTAIVFAALDLAFTSTIDRPFRAVDDWPQLVAAAGVVSDATGIPGLVAAMVLLTALLIGLIWILAAAALRVGSAVTSAGRRGRTAASAVAAVWVAGAVLGAQLVPGIPFAAADAARAIVVTGERAVLGVRESREFERALGSDGTRSTEGLLSGLAGKDVVIAFIESYGRVAVEGTAFSAGVDEVLREGDAQLARGGYSAESAFLTSPTFGGVSWLAHSTLASGVWVDSQQKYDSLLASDRETLSTVFADAGWRTVAVVPSNDRPWPEGIAFYGWDAVYDSRNLGYRGPAFSYARVPDQFTWQQFHERELAGDHAPVMAEIDFVSSHTPWTPLPELVPWTALGDGTVFDVQPGRGEAPIVAWQDAERVQELYGESIEYSLGALFSYLETYDQENLVIIVVGDHQPARIVSGRDADHDVPITVIAKDTAVLERIAAWQWEPGVLPSPAAPVWGMDEFRDRFLDAFSG